MKITSVSSICALFFALAFGTSARAHTSTDTVWVEYSESPTGIGGLSQSSHDVKVGDVIVFSVGYLDHCADQVYLYETTLPNGAPNPIPTGSAIEIDNTTGHSFAYKVDVEGAYCFVLDNGPKVCVDSFNARPSAPSSSVRDDSRSSGLSMTVTPNPGNGAATINLHADKPLDLQLVLMDAAGRQVHEYDHIGLSSSASLPLTSDKLPSGEYYLRAIAGGAIVAMTKVLVVH